MFELSNYGRPRNPFWDLWRSVDKDFQHGIDFKDFRIDVTDKGDCLELDAELPGFEKGDIKIQIEKGYLTISAEKSVENKKEEEGKVIHRERHYGKYQRTFDISNVDEKEVKASYKDGILKVKLPKKNVHVEKEKKTIAIE